MGVELCATVEELVDLYFGEGAFDSVVAFALKVLNLKPSEIKGFLADNGIEYESFIDIVLMIATTTGMPDSYRDKVVDTIDSFFETDIFEDKTIGMLIFENIDAKLYTDYINDFAKPFTEKSFYELNLLPAGFTKEVVDSYIEYLADIRISFTTDSDGMLKVINVALDKFEADVDGGKIVATLDIGHFHSSARLITRLFLAMKVFLLLSTEFLMSLL